MCFGVSDGVAEKSLYGSVLYPGKSSLQPHSSRKQIFPLQVRLGLESVAVNTFKFIVI